MSNEKNLEKEDRRHIYKVSIIIGVISIFARIWIIPALLNSIVSDLNFYESFLLIAGIVIFPCTTLGITSILIYSIPLSISFSLIGVLFLLDIILFMISNYVKKISKKSI